MSLLPEIKQMLEIAVQTRPHQFQSESNYEYEKRLMQHMEAQLQNPEFIIATLMSKLRSGAIDPRLPDLEKQLRDAVIFAMKSESWSELGYAAAFFEISCMADDAKKKLEPYARREGHSKEWWEGYYHAAVAAYSLSAWGEFPGCNEEAIIKSIKASNVP